MADIDTFVKLLGGAHGAVGGHTEFAHGVLLHGGGGKGGRRVAAALFLFDGSNLRVFTGQSGQYFRLTGFVGQRELFEFFALPLHQLGGEFTAAFVAVEMQRPVFLCFKGADFVFALANQPQGGALYATCTQAAADFFPQQR